jgi:maleate isomerase
MEPDFHQHIGTLALISTTRILLENVTRQDELRMLEEHLPGAIELIRSTAPDVVVFGCTSAGALGTLAHNEAIGESIRAGAGTGVITVLGAVLKKVCAIDPRRIAVFTPYTEDLTNCIASSLNEAGYPPVKAVGMGIHMNLDIGKVGPTEIVRFVESEIDGLSFDCVFLSCTNWRSVEALPLLQKRLGVPVITSNQAAMDEVGRVAALSWSARDVSDS